MAQRGGGEALVSQRGRVAVAAVLVLVGGVCPLLRSPREKLRFRLSYAVALRRVPVDTLCQPCPGRCPWGSQAAPGAAFE